MIPKSRFTVPNNHTHAQMFKIFLRELRNMATTPIYWFVLVVGPLFCTLLFTTLMRDGLPGDLPVGVVDMDRTATTRNLVRNIDAFQVCHVTGHYATVSDARKAMQRNEIYAYYYIPEGTTRKLLAQQSPIVSFYTNPQFLVAASLTYKDMRMMSELMGGAATRTVLTAKGVGNAQQMGMLQPIVIDCHPISNPSLNYSVYLNNILLPGIFSLFFLFMTVYSIGMEIKEGTADSLMETAANGGKTTASATAFRALFGKLAAHSTVMLAVSWALMAYLYGALHFPCLCGLPTMLGVMALFVFASQGLGTFMICSLPGLRMGLSFASLWGVISFSICGMSFPTMAMPAWIQGISVLFPLRHYYLLYVNCALDGYALANAWPFVAALCLFALLPLLLVRRFGRIMLHTAYVA